MASWYDPLGLASPLIVQAKIALREVCRLSWDQTVPEEKLAWWRSWFQRILKVTDWGVPRCLLPGDEEPTDIQLHIFCDASTESFAAAAYLRSVQADGKVINPLVMARTRLPGVSTTICCLELQAAVLGVRLSAYGEEALGISGLKHVYLTDSAVVRGLGPIAQTTRSLWGIVSQRYDWQQTSGACGGSSLQRLQRSRHPPSSRRDPDSPLV